MANRRENRSWPGAVSNHWRQKRRDAVLFYERHHGQVPALLYRWKISDRKELHQSEEWKRWMRQKT